jgi:hypothetical protein
MDGEAGHVKAMLVSDKERDEDLFSTIARRWKDIGLENDDFKVQLTEADAKIINNATSLIGGVSDIIEELQGACKLATTVIHDVIFKHRYVEYLKRYPDHAKMQREQEDQSSGLRSKIEEMGSIVEKIREISRVLFG